MGRYQDAICANPAVRDALAALTDHSPRVQLAERVARSTQWNEP
jgi:hypothetical protein